MNSTTIPRPPARGSWRGSRWPGTKSIRNRTRTRNCWNPENLANPGKTTNPGKRRIRNGAGVEYEMTAKRLKEGIEVVEDSTQPVRGNKESTMQEKETL